MLHAPRRIVANTFLYTGTLMIQKVISFLYFWFLSAQLSPELLGIYVWSLSLTGLFSIGVDLGLSPLLIREAAKDRSRAENFLRGVLGLKLLFGIITISILAVAVLLSGRDPLTFMVVAVATLVMLFDSFSMSFWGVMRARQIVFYESMGMLSFHVLVFALGAYLLSIAQNPLSAIIALAAGSCAVFVYALVVVRFKIRLRVSPRFDRETFHFLLHLLPAFAAAGIFVRIYNVADSVLLGYFIGNEAVGLYSVPAKVVTALQMLVPAAFVATIYPAMSHYYVTSRVQLTLLFERSVGYLAACVFPITIGLFVLAPRVVAVVWPEYIRVTDTFLLMILALPFLFLSFATGYVLNACDRQRQNTINRGIITVVNIVLNIFLIPVLGVYGAGIAFLVTNTLLFFLDAGRVRQFLTITWGWLGRVCIKTIVASIVMGVCLIWLQPYLSLGLSVLLGVVVYPICLLVFRTFSREEFQMIRDLFKRSSSDV